MPKVMSETKRAALIAQVQAENPYSSVKWEAGQIRIDSYADAETGRSLESLQTENIKQAGKEEPLVMPSTVTNEDDSKALILKPVPVRNQKASKEEPLLMPKLF